ncbi:tyrosyl-DNA phosphodiesterase-domain-containing protein [Xylariomycetidae sp. FL0641]|nr:tyrosyl-DNA phosphodiesterase-domain-containing protein [Xylariomycetidae sp. FL0641]
MADKNLKRKAETDPPCDEEQDDTLAGAAPARHASKIPSDGTRASSQIQTLTTPISPPRTRLVYPGGALRITRTPGRRDTKNCVNLEDVIQKRRLVSACIFSFFIADDELFRHLPLSHSSDEVPIYVGRDPNMDPTVEEACDQAGVVVNGKTTSKQLDALRPQISRLHCEKYGKNFHAFHAWASGSSHSKILVLMYTSFLRIVITSCNMMDIDTVLGDNHWYIHDLPKREVPAEDAPSGFEADLLAHLRALGTPDKFVDSIRGKYDYATVKVRLVTSVPGTHSGEKAEAYGLLRLRRVLTDLDLDLPTKERAKKLSFEVCAASIGNLSAKWLHSFHSCALGAESLQSNDEASEVPDLKIFYPTTADVRAAHESAQDGAVSIGCHIRPWNAAPGAIKRLFHHYESKDAGHLFHQKMILAYNPADRAALPYYVYVGSANLSQSAWGALERDRKGNEATCDMKLVKMANFECGVVVPGNLLSRMLEPGIEDWRDGIVPFNQEARRYDTKTDRPWNDPRWVQALRGE